MNLMLHQILLEIQNHLQQVPTTSDVELQQLERLKTPLGAIKHGLIHRNVGRSSSKKRHQDARKRKSGGSIFTEFSSRKHTSKDLSSSDIGSSFPKRKKKVHS
jgi:hypothetical protein